MYKFKNIFKLKIFKNLITYGTINIPVFMMDVFYLIKHFSDHKKSNNSSYNIYRHYLHISSKVNYYD